MIASNAATAVGFCGRPDRPRMRLVSCKPVTKGNLRGFAIVELPIGLTIFDCRAKGVCAVSLRSSCRSGSSSSTARHERRAVQ
jgi:hypothetical protein